MIANVQSSLRTAVLFTGDDLAALLKVVNHQAYVSSAENRYAAFLRSIRRVDPHSALCKCRPQSAGRHSARWFKALAGNGSDSEYEEGIVKLEAGDLLIAFTDGLIEATNQDGEEWGVQGLLKAAVCGAQFSQDAGDLVNLIFNTVDGFSQGHQTDDATLAVVRVEMGRGYSEHLDRDPSCLLDSTISHAK
jgi:hypothetical protein